MKATLKSLSWLVLGVFLASAGPSGAVELPDTQIDPQVDRLQRMDIEQLLECKIQIASLKPLTTRKSPGVVTLITREQIVQSGARDLLEILRLFCPGYHAVNWMTGIVLGGFRGIDSRALFLLDGMPITEEEAGTFPLGNEFPVDTIERIEIMRGPGSVLYGGFASTAVVNIITRKTPGAGYVSWLGSRSGKEFTHDDLTMGVTRTFPNSQFNLSGMIGRGNRSDRNQIDYYRNSMEMTGNQGLDPEHLHLQYQTEGGFAFQALTRHYFTTNINLWGKNHYQGPLGLSYTTQAFEMKQRMEVGKKKNWTIVPRLFYKLERPWHLSVTDVDPIERGEGHLSIQRVTGEITAQGSLDDHTDAKFGYEHSNYVMSLPDTRGPYEELIKGGDQPMRYSRQAFFGEVLREEGDLLLSLGGRYEESPQSGKALVPRFSLSRGWGDLNLKLSKSGSFRTPAGIELNRVPNGYPKLNPEKAVTDEIEIGYKFSPRTFASLNLFDVKFHDLIQYIYDINSVGYFTNVGRLGTRGFELELMHNCRRVRTNLNWAYYRSTRNDVAGLQVPGVTSYNLGFPRHQFNALVSIDVGDGWWCNPTVSWFGKRYGFDHGVVSTDAAGNVTVADVLKNYGPTAIWNLNFHRDRGNQGLSFDIGIHDLFQSDYSFMSSFNSRVAPMPGPSRGVSLRVEMDRRF